MDNYLRISCRVGTEDWNLFTSIIDEGIDARLTAFTKSTFAHKNSRLFMDFHKNELEILMRRLSKHAETDENADLWEDDILIDVFMGGAE